MSIDTHAGLHWLSDDVLEVGGTRFLLSVDPEVYTVHPATSREFMLVKRKEMVDWLVDRLPPEEISTIFEVGLYKGGSTAFLNALLRPEIHLAVELEAEPVTALDEFAATAASGQLKRFYGVDQADEIALAGILEEHLEDRPLDLIVDDASHLYRETRSTFEVTFPRLRPGGRYIIEDWNWAHMDEDLWQYAGGYWADRPALTNLIVELVMVAGTDRSAIAEITVDRDMVEVVRGDRSLPTPFRLATAYLNRGLRFRPIL
ncbi:MAG: class I SAM-dependent methyltransferase [Acidimicrobiales bacterium]|nr:class I SAM-dependent methyltransferase [Acidimicrobiales bacterium]